MKLYFTDNNNNKKLIGEFTNLDSAIGGVIEDRRRKFVFSDDVNVRIDFDNKNILFVNHNDEELGYSVEE